MRSTISSNVVASTGCEVRAVIQFLCAKGSQAVQIYRVISLVSGLKITSEGNVRQ